MLRTDIVVPKRACLFDSQLHDPLRARRIIRILCRIGSLLINDCLYAIAHGIKIQSKRAQCPGSYTFALMQQPQQQMFRADIVLLQILCLILCIFQNPDSPGCKSIVHSFTFVCYFAPKSHVPPRRAVYLSHSSTYSHFLPGSANNSCGLR